MSDEGFKDKKDAEAKAAARAAQDASDQDPPEEPRTPSSQMRTVVGRFLSEMKVASSRCPK